MATLTETAYLTRKTIKYGTIALIGLFLLKSALSTAITYWRKIHPPPPPPPTVAFGKLPKIQFPESRFKQEGLVYRLETITGGTPNLGDKTNVYFMPTKKPGLLALDRAEKQAIKLGFSGPGKKISETIYRWQKNDPLLTTLEMNIINHNLTIKKEWQEDQSLLGVKRLPVEEQAIIEAKNFLNTSGLLTVDLGTGKTKAFLLRFVPPNLVPAISLSEADFVRVNLFREDLNNLPLLPPDQKETLVSLLFSGSRNQEKRIVEVNYIHFPIAKETFATYPLKTSAQAWEELKAGRGFITNLETGEKQIVVRKIYLAYFENNLPQDFLQPIFVFEGNNDFTAYVPAISPEWTN